MDGNSSQDWPPRDQFGPDGFWPEEPSAPPRPDYGKDIRWAALTGAVVAVLGFPLAAVWQAVAPKLPLRKVADGAIYTAPDPEQVIAGDGWFAILGLVFGLIVAVLAWAVGRRRRGAIQLVGLTLGCLAAGFLAVNVVGADARDDFQEQLAAAPVDSLIQRPPQIRVASKPFCGEDTQDCVQVGGVLLTPALGAAIGYTLLAAWSNRPELRPDEVRAAGESWTSGPY